VASREHESLRALQDELMEPRLAPLRDKKLGALGFVVAGERLVDGVMEQEREVDLRQTKLREAVSRVEAGKNVCPVVVPAVRLCVRATTRARRLSGQSNESRFCRIPRGDVSMKRAWSP